MEGDQGRSNFFTGKSALVTGASNGIGRAVAEALADKGCAVTVVDVNVADGEETARQGGGEDSVFFANAALRFLSCVSASRIANEWNAASCPSHRRSMAAGKVH